MAATSSSAAAHATPPRCRRLGAGWPAAAAASRAAAADAPASKRSSCTVRRSWARANASCTACSVPLTYGCGRGAAGKQAGGQGACVRAEGGSTRLLDAAWSKLADSLRASCLLGHPELLHGRPLGGCLPTCSTAQTAAVRVGAASR